MYRICLIAFFTASINCLLVAPVAAQTNRPFGMSLQPQASPGGGMFGSATSQQPSSIAGNPPGNAPAPRYLRGTRSAKEFVGNEGSKKFVGSVQTDGTFVRPAAADAIERRLPEVLLNPPRTQPSTKRMYDPKLSVAFRHEPRTANEVSARLQIQMDRLTRRDPSIQVVTTVAGETVHLEGQVPSEEQKLLVEEMMFFEPGISAVQNDLKVLSDAP